jgi:hypothetical protein
MNDAGGWLWLLIDVGFVLVFAGALIYGLVEWRRRRQTQSPAMKQIRDRATRDLYRGSGNN